MIAKVSAIDTADPTFKPSLIEISKLTMKANTQTTPANAALVEAVTTNLVRQRWYVESGAMPPVLMLEDDDPKGRTLTVPPEVHVGQNQKIRCNYNSELRAWRSLGESNPCFSLERAAS